MSRILYVIKAAAAMHSAVFHRECHPKLHPSSVDDNVMLYCLLSSHLLFLLITKQFACFSPLACYDKATSMENWNIRKSWFPNQNVDNNTPELTEFQKRTPTNYGSYNRDHYVYSYLWSPLDRTYLTLRRRRPHFVGKRSPAKILSGLRAITEPFLADVVHALPGHHLSKRSVVKSETSAGDALSALDDPPEESSAPLFLGSKRAAPGFVGKRAETMDSLEADMKRARMFVGKREDTLEPFKRVHMFVGKREDDDLEKRARMFVGKRAHMFVGKRSEEDFDEDYEKRARMFVGKRDYSAPQFVGDASELADKRARMFVGKRNPMFVGKRDKDLEDFEIEEGKRARMFVGKRLSDFDNPPDELETEKRARMFVGKRSDAFDTLSDELDSKRARMFVGKRSDELNALSDELDEEKRARMFVGKRTSDLSELSHELDVEKRARMFVGKRAGDIDEADYDKRARMFVGKRTGDIDEADYDKRARMFVGKRTGEDLAELASVLANADNKRAPFFVGKKSDTAEDGQYFSLDEKRAPRFIGKKLAPGFVGKRYAPSFIGKRRIPGFVGRRRVPGFIGKRARMFVGKRDSYDVVKRSALSNDKQDSLPAEPRIQPDGSAKHASDRISNTNLSQEKSSTH